MSNKSISDTITALLVFLFLYTGVNKYIDMKIFRFSLSQAPIIQDHLNLVSYTLPGIEILITILLVIPKTRLKGLYASLILLSIFTIYLIAMVFSTSQLPCGCGGVINKLTWKQHILFNLFFVIISIVGIRLHRNAIKASNGQVNTPYLETSNQ
jgi:hypothetical protein